MRADMASDVPALTTSGRGRRDPDTPSMGAALKKPKVAVGAAAAVAEVLLVQRRPAGARRLAPRGRRVESAAAALFVATAFVMAAFAPAAGDLTTTILLTLC